MMSSDQINDDVAAEARLCENNCGFFGTPATMNLCSSCFTAAFGGKQQQSLITTTSFECSATTTGGETSSSSQTTELSSSKPAPAPESRCRSCNRKVGLASRFVCKCGSTFCGAHRLPEEHTCEFDFKRAGREVIANSNPVVKADKITRF